MATADALTRFGGSAVARFASEGGSPPFRHNAV
jgi:hypothetical protein